MAENTKIEWCDHTWNPWIGCTKISPGCKHCYAENLMDKRMGVAVWGPGNERVRTKEANWKMPLRWNAQADAFMAQHGRRQRVFCASLADWLDNQVDAEWLVDLLEVVRTTPNLDWLLLSKRIGTWRARIKTAFEWVWVNARVRLAELLSWLADWLDGKAPANVWIGATIVNQPEADRDITKLLAVPARVRYLSMEPLLGPVDLGKWIGDEDCHVCGARFYGDEIRLHLPAGPEQVRVVDFEDDPEDENDIRRVCPACGQRDDCGEVGEVDEESLGGGIDWVIVGGESGPGARPMHPDWARSLRDQCEAAGVPFLFKQWGEWAPGSGDFGRGSFQTAAVSSTGTVVDGGYEKAGYPKGASAADGWAMVHRAGKKAAGRLLDGRSWDGFPAP